MGDSDNLATPLDLGVRPIVPPVRDEVLDEEDQIGRAHV